MPIPAELVRRSNRSVEKALVGSTVTRSLLDESVYVDIDGKAVNLSELLQALIETVDYQRYETLIFKYSLNQSRIDVTNGRVALADQVAALQRTSWTEGFSFWSIDLSAADPNDRAVTRWKRTNAGVQFDHECSIMYPASAFDDDEATTIGTTTWNAVEQRMIFSAAPVDYRRMEDAATIQYGVTITTEPVTLDGSLNVVLTDDGIFTALDGEEYAQSFPVPWDSSGGNYFADALTQSATGDPTNMQIRVQTSVESENLFFLRLFGAAATPFISKVAQTSESYRWSVGGDTRFPILAFAAANGWTRVVNGDLDLDAPNPGLTIEKGIMWFNGNVQFPGAPVPDPDLFSLWANDGSSIDDKLFTALPSNVISTANLVNVVSFQPDGSPVPERPYAQIELDVPGEDPARTYTRPFGSLGDDLEAVYMNYMKVTSDATGAGCFGVEVPNTTVWYFQKPGTSAWIIGTKRGSMENVTNPAGDSQAGLAHEWWFTNFTTLFAPLNKDPPASANSSLWPSYVLSDDARFEKLGARFLRPRDSSGAVVGTVPVMAWMSGAVDQIPGITPRASITFVCVNGSDPANDPFQDPGSLEPLEQINSDLLPAPVIFATYFENESIPASAVTRSILDTGEFSLDGTTLGTNFNYGTIEVNGTLQRSGEIKSLFPPLWYLQTQASFSTQYNNLAQKVRYLENTAVAVNSLSLNAVLTSLDKVGMTNELLTLKIMQLSDDLTQLELNMEKMMNFVTTAIETLGALITETYDTALALVDEEEGFLLNLVQGTVTTCLSMASCIPVYGAIFGLTNAFIGNVATVTNSYFRTKTITDRISNLTSQASTLLQNPDNKEQGVATMLFGMMASQLMVDTVNRNGDGDPVEVDGTLSINDSAINPFPLEDPELIERFFDRAQPPNPDDEGLQIYEAMIDVSQFASANEGILEEIREFEDAHGIVDVFDPVLPLSTAP
jgi:hypothetical protein